MENTCSKQETYAWQKARLKRALACSFYYEAVFIEYAMFEDRAISVLRHLGCKTVDRNGKPLKLSKKLDLINDAPAFQSKYVKQRLTRDLVENIRAWKDQRDTLVHDLMSAPANDQAAREIAEAGEKLLGVFDNKVRSVNDHVDKKSKT